MTRHLFSSLVLLLVLGLAACGPREPGPLESDRGKVTYWVVTGTSVTFDACTDAQAWQSDVTPEAPSENSYLMYLVSEDGTQAVAQSCTSTRASSCEDSATGIVFDVQGHLLSHDPAPEISDLTGTICDLELDQLWEIEDRGDTGTMEVAIGVALVGDPTACTALDDQVKLESGNGLGFDGCTVTLAVELDFDQAQTP